MFTSLRVLMACLCALWLWGDLAAGSAFAQPPKDADAALARGDYAEARTLALTVIESGTATATELVSPYRVLAMSCAYLDDVEAATRAFTTLLALDPTYRLPEGLPPQVRSPYMNARGFWSLHVERLSAQVELDQDPAQMLLRVQDPAGLVARARLRTRPVGKSTFIESVRVPAPQLTVLVTGLADLEEVEYTLALLDEHGNRIWQVGSDLTPERLARPKRPEVAQAVNAPAPLAQPGEPQAASPAQPGRRRPYLVVGSSLLVLGALSAAGGGYAHLRHQQLAQRWNTGDCQGSGTTRGSICASENREMKDMTQLAVLLYGAGAAALVTGTVVLLLSKARTSEREPTQTAFGCTQGPGAIGLACTSRF